MFNVFMSLSVLLKLNFSNPYGFILACNLFEFSEREKTGPTTFARCVYVKCLNE